MLTTANIVCIYKVYRLEKKKKKDALCSIEWACGVETSIIPCTECDSPYEAYSLLSISTCCRASELPLKKTYVRLSVRGSLSQEAHSYTSFSQNAPRRKTRDAKTATQTANQAAALHMAVAALTEFQFRWCFLRCVWLGRTHPVFHPIGALAAHAAHTHVSTSNNPTSGLGYIGCMRFALCNSVRLNRRSSATA